MVWPIEFRFEYSAKETENWKLISPTGKIFEAETPIKCCQKEIDSRVSKEVQANRLLEMMSKCSLCEEGERKYTIGKNTPAEIPGICETCLQTIYSDCLDIMSGIDGR